MKKLPGWLIWIVIIPFALLLLIQLVPYGRDHTNPPVLSEPAWDSPTTRALAQRACFDCHSNETVYPWYSNIAPTSWLLQKDIEEGRSNMNFSEWEQGGSEDLDELQEVIESGEMPPAIYLPMHPEARLNDAEKAQLLEGLQATLGD